MNSLKRTSIPLGALLVAAFAVGAESVGATGHAGDFNGDGADDVLLRHLHSDAWRYYTLVDDVPVAHDLAIPADPAWRFVATGDFDGNGYDDVLLRNVDTLASVYYAVTATGTEKRAISLTKNPLYDFLGVGDFDGDGKDEILIRRREDYGVWFYYDVEGTRATLRRDSGATQNLAWDFAGIGDFNGDGRDDILIRHSEFLNWIYYEMNGTTARAVLRRPGITRNPLFTFHAVADITGDGRDDVMLRNTKSREWIYYAMTGPRALLQRPPGMTRNPRWTLHAIGDFDGSGRATPLIRLSVSGGWALYDIQGLDAQVVHFPGMSREQTWAAVGTLPAFHEGNPAQFSRIEFLQGPPTFRKDFVSGEVIGPINASRPENGGPALDSVTSPWEDSRWLESNRGFVTAVWRRRLVVAVATEHPYSFPLPEIAVRVIPEDGNAADLPVLYDVTEAAGAMAAGYRTEMVFDLRRDMNAPGAAIEVTLRSGEGEQVEMLPLFGETVEEIVLRWVPISTDSVPAVDDLGTEGYTSAIAAYLPIADYQAAVAEAFPYQITGEEQEGVDFDDRQAFIQLRMHQAEHGCGYGEMYVGVYNGIGMIEAGVVPDLPFAAYGGDGLLLLSGALPEPHGENKFLSTGAHEYGHATGLGHMACPESPEPPVLDERYPYADGALGPARGWHHLAGEFIDSGGHEYGHWGTHVSENTRDIMSYCFPVFVSDFTYQHVLTFLQAPFFKTRMEETKACMAERSSSTGAYRSLAIVGEVHENGNVTVLDMRPSDQPPWGVPSVETSPPGARPWTIELLDAGGGVTHRQALPVTMPTWRDPNPESHHDMPTTSTLWSYRIPFPERSETVVVRDPTTDLRVSTPIRCDRCAHTDPR